MLLKVPKKGSSIAIGSHQQLDITSALSDGWLTVEEYSKREVLCPFYWS